MLGDGAATFVEQRADQLLRQPDGFVRDPNFDAVLAGLPGKDQELGGAIADLKFFLIVHSGRKTGNKKLLLAR